jgi:hypothetical protein
MKIVRTKEIDGCLDEIVKEFQVDRLITTDDIFHFGKIGQLEYYPEMKKPFYKVKVKKKFHLKGIQGNDTIRVLFHDNDYHDHLNELIEHIESAYPFR